MNLEVLTPEKILFQGQVNGIMLPGTDGLFELLNNHAPIISALKDGDLILDTADGKKTIQIKSGFVECLHNQVVVLVEGGSAEG